MHAMIHVITYVLLHTMDPIMTRLLSNRFVSITELREPNKVINQAGDQPVAIMRNNKCVGYFVPETLVEDVQAIPADRTELVQALKRTRKADQPILEALKDK